MQECRKLTKCSHTAEKIRQSPALLPLIEHSSSRMEWKSELLRKESSGFVFFSRPKLNKSDICKARQRQKLIHQCCPT